MTLFNKVFQKKASLFNPGLRGMLMAFTASALTITAIVSATSLWGARQAANAATQTFVAKDVTADILPPPMYLIELRLVLSQLVEGSLPLDTARAEVKRLESEYQSRVKYWQDNPPYGLQAQLLGAQHEAGLAFIEKAKSVLAARGAQTDASTLRATLADAHRGYLRHREGVNTTVDASTSFAEQSMAAFASTLKSTMQWQWLLMALAAMGLAGFGVWICRAVWSAVGGEPAFAATVARSVAEGNLSIRVKTAPNHGKSILAAMAHMSDALATIVKQVRASSDSIANGSSEIAQGNSDLSTRTLQQAAVLSKASAAMEALRITVGQTSDHAQQAHRLVLEASGMAEKGGHVVGQVVAEMKGINDSSKKIADIIGVIDSIAFQTNILALNAAVESARAGEQGRGFAVVASEVRGLAGRSAAAAKEVENLITESVRRVAQGAALVDRAGATMTEVVNSIKKAAVMMGEISAASARQSTGVDQVDDAVRQIDSTTRRNAELVAQSAAAAEDLMDQATRLEQAVSVFRLAPAAA